MILDSTTRSSIIILVDRIIDTILYTSTGTEYWCRDPYAGSRVEGSVGLQQAKTQLFSSGFAFPEFVVCGLPRGRTVKTVQSEWPSDCACRGGLANLVLAGH